MSKIVEEQHETCRTYGIRWVEAPDTMKVGLARNVRAGPQRVNGLRHAPEGDTTGWCIWAGQGFSDAADFFEPVHVLHLADLCPSVLRLLGLPPGWRFLKHGDHLDVWEDVSLLDT